MLGGRLNVGKLSPRPGWGDGPVSAGGLLTASCQKQGRREGVFLWHLVQVWVLKNGWFWLCLWALCSVVEHCLTVLYCGYKPPFTFVINIDHSHRTQSRLLNNVFLTISSNTIKETVLCSKCTTIIKSRHEEHLLNRLQVYSKDFICIYTPGICHFTVYLQL